MTDAIEIRPLVAEEAEKLSACFQRCYGDTYVVAFFYDPTAIRARIVDGRLRSVIALSPDGEVVGHMALMRPHPEALTVELGNAIVDPRYRRHGLLGRLGTVLVEECRVAGAVGYHHYQTTAHPIIQKAAVEAGGVETGVMLGYIPEGTDYLDLGRTPEHGRLAVVTVYQPIVPAPARKVFLPRRFETMLRGIYTRARLDRETLGSLEPPVSSSTKLRSYVDVRRGLLRVEVQSVGDDLCDRIVELERLQPAEVLHVDFLLSDPAVGSAVEELRPHGFFFCALLPEFAATDVLRLQRLRTDSWVRPELVNPQARAILDAALADRRSASKGRGMSDPAKK